MCDIISVEQLTNFPTNDLMTGEGVLDTVTDDG